MSSATPAPLRGDDVWLRRFWHPLLRAGELPAGAVRRVLLLGEALVVARLEDGGLALVAPDRCPHRAAQLSRGQVVAGALQCPYHGWRFGAGGACSLVPALGADGSVPGRSGLDALPVREAMGLVWTCLEPGQAPEGTTGPPQPEAHGWGPGAVPLWLPVVEAACSAAQFIDNFCDVAHFPFVHAGTFGADEDERVGELDVTHDGPASLRLRHDHEVANREDPAVATGAHPLVQPRTMDFRWTAPFTASLALALPLAGTAHTIVTVASPTTATSTTIFTALLRDDLVDPAGEEALAAVAYELAILGEDLRVLEHLAEATFALDLPALRHTRADRFTVALRRVLAEVLQAPGA